VESEYGALLGVGSGDVQRMTCTAFLTEVRRVDECA
jgi:hypothetical protein